MTVPSNLIPTRITQLPLAENPTPADTVVLVQGGVTKRATLASTTAATAVPVTRRIDTGGGLVGGGDLSANRTISLAPYFSSGIWGGASFIPVISVDQYGRVDAASQVPLTFANVGAKPTTLAGYGITDGVNDDRRVDTAGSLVGGGRLNTNLTLSLSGDQASPGASKYYGTDGSGTKGFFDITAGGTVQQVALTMPSDVFAVAGSPITTSGTFAVTLAVQPPNQILAGPASGVLGAAPAFRALVAADLPVVPVAKGGTGATDAPTALSNLGAVPSTRQVATGTGLTGGGNLSADRTIALANTAVSPGTYGSASQVAQVTVDAQGRLTSAANVSVAIDAAAVTTGTLPVARGGTGAATLTGYVKGNGTSAFTASPTIPNGDLQNSSLTIGSTPIALGGTATTISGLTTLTLTQNPVNPLEAATKQYVDAAVEGLNVHAAAQAATTANLTATYNNGTGGVGATLTNAGAQAAFAVDGYTAALNDRILVKNQSAPAENGVYTVTTVGSGSTNWVLTRATDMNTAGTGANQIGPGDYVFVVSGTQNGGTSWVITTPLPITVGTTPITFTQFAGPGTYTAGAGLTLTGTQFSVTDTGVTPASYGTASSVPTVALNSRGQVTSASNTPIAIDATQVTSGTLNTARLSGAYTGITGVGTLTSPTVISTNSASDALRITQTGTGNALVVEDSANPDATPFVVSNDGRVVVGHTAPLTTAPGTASSPLQVQTNIASADFASVGVVNWVAGVQGTGVQLSKSRSGVIGTRGIVSDGDAIGRVQFNADDGVGFIAAARIEALVDGTPGTNDMPGRLVFSTTADGASSPTERMRIDNLGRVGINSTALTGYQVRIAGTYASTDVNPIWMAINGTIPSTATGQAYGFFSGSATQAAAFTLTGLNHFFASQGGVGAGSTLTNQYGFRANSNLTGATNNFGFYSDIASGTGRWNFYANGTADNYFAGNVGIGTASPGSRLQVAGTVTATAYSGIDGGTF